MRFFSKKRARINYNRAKHAAEIDKATEEAARQAARLWLENALSRVPTWSGASLATFERLAAEVGIPVNIPVKQNAPNRIALGRLNSGGGVHRNSLGHWTFSYKTDLRYLLANDTQHVSVGEHGVIWGLLQDTPYQFGETGRQIVEEFAKTVKLPRPRLT